MAEGTATAGKGLAGCSGCLVAMFLALTVLLSLGAGFIVELTDGRASYNEVAPLSYVSSVCCCLSGVGVVLGIVLILVGGRSSVDA